MKHTFSYRSGDIELRPLTLEDSEQYRILRNQEQNRIRFFHDAEISAENQRAWFERYLSDDTDVMFAFYYRGIFAGGNAIYHIDRSRSRAEHGRILADKQRFPFRGLGSAMIQGAAAIAREKMGLSVLYAEIYADNLPSLHAHLNAGFREVEIRTLPDGRKVLYMEYDLSSVLNTHGGVQECL